MSTEKEENGQGTCFVVMGFGKKTDFETGRTLDLDKTYQYIIKPAVTAAGLKCIRADEIAHSGVIDVPMYQQLLSADVVVADLSTSNKNAFYELGVRHALQPYTTIIICEDAITSFPFDVNHVSIKKYHHMGDGIDFGEVERFRGVLTKAIVEIYQQKPRPKDSPVYTFLNNLTPPSLKEAIEDMAEAVAKSAPAAAAAASEATGKVTPDETHSALMQKVDAAQSQGQFEAAKFLLGMIREQRPDDPDIIRRLALVTYKNKNQPLRERFEEARDLLATLQPATSNDTETLGLWGAVHKNLWNETKDKKHLDEAIRGYERGFYIRNDYYNGINFAYMLNERAAHATDRAEAVADYVQARRVREEVVEICDEWLKATPEPAESASKEAKDEYLNSKYWVVASKAEAYLGMGKTAEADAIYNEAYSFAPADWMEGSTKGQRANLEKLLNESPLKYVKTDGE
jgi:tetratricopeptide (TPR) repeat protein